MDFIVAGQTHTGLKRSENQDRILVKPDWGLFAVADGMGGHRAGDRASTLTLSGLDVPPPYQLENYSMRNTELLQDMKPWILERSRKAHEEVCQLSQSDEAYRGMGSTLTSLWIHPESAWLAQVGDSRCYLMRKGQLWQLTRDHSVVQEKIHAGLITSEQAKNDRQRNMITRAMGYERVIRPDLFHLIPQADDVFLICSDGLCGLVPDQEWLPLLKNFDLLKQAEKKLQIDALTEQLISVALDHGGLDNVSVIVVALGA